MTRSVRISCSVALACICLTTELCSQQTWMKLVGGNNDGIGSGQRGRSVIAAPDGGYVVAGYTDTENGDFEGLAKGNGDAVAFHISSKGRVTWKQTYGGSGRDEAHGVVATNDGGYVIVGQSGSNDGNFTGLNHNNQSSYKQYLGTSIDAFAVKIDKQGRLQWANQYGGSGTDVATSVVASHDGGFVIAGTTESQNGDFPQSASKTSSGSDIFVMKISATGSIVWKKRLQGSQKDVATSVCRGRAGDYLVTGWSSSNDGDFKGMSKNLRYSWYTDVIAICLDESGKVQWKKSYGGQTDDRGDCVYATSDGGYIISGKVGKTDGDFGTSSQTCGDGVGLLKISYAGNVQWSTSYCIESESTAIVQTRDGGYCLTGSIDKYSKELVSTKTGISGDGLLILKLDGVGKKTWARAYGNSGDDYGIAIVEAKDGGFVICGRSSSSEDPGGHFFSEMHRFWGYAICILKTDQAGKAP